MVIFFFKQKTAYEMRISDWSSDVCSSDLWLSPDDVEMRDGQLVEIATGAPASAGRVEKMSKSKKNVIDPSPIIDQYGADAVRWFMLSDSPPERDLAWSEAGIEGAWRFVQRVWRLVDGTAPADGGDADLDRKLHKTIAGVGEDVDALQFNKAVAKQNGRAHV